MEMQVVASSPAMTPAESPRGWRLVRLLHRAVPAAQMRQIRQFGFSVEEIVFEHAVEIVVDEDRPVGQEKRRGRQHVVDRLQQIGKSGTERPALSSPFPDAAPPEFPLLVADEHCAFDQRALRDHVGIVYLKPHHLQLLLDVAREDELQSVEPFRKEVESIVAIDVASHFLAQFRHIADPALPVDKAGNGVAGSLCRVDDRRAIMKGDVVQLERNAMAFQDVPDCDAERRPGKLNQREHAGHMNEGDKKLQGLGSSLCRSESTTARCG